MLENSSRRVHVGEVITAKDIFRIDFVGKTNA